MSHWRSYLIILPALLLATVASRAGDAPRPPDTHLVNLQAEARSELPNDLLVATLFVEMTDKDPTRLAAAVSRTLNGAMKLRESFPALTFTSGGQSTWPVYGKDNRQDGWRTRATLRIEGTDFDAAAKALARLQETMQLEQVGFSVSRASIVAAENRLITDAISAFGARADLVAKALGMPGWRVVNISVNSGSDMPPPMPMHKARAMMAAEAGVPAQEFAGGNSTVSVQVGGTIQLQ